ncbi:hypothetical protein ACA30_03550 [Virgibacillus soli]|nr:hypothetical protein ACA30_03550 [Virgibacillus soli]
MFWNPGRVFFPFRNSRLFDLEPLPPIARQRKAEGGCLGTTSKCSGIWKDVLPFQNYGII